MQIMRSEVVTSLENKNSNPWKKERNVREKRFKSTEELARGTEIGYIVKG